MVMIYEYRIPLPFTMEEYEIAQLYMVAKYSASESSGDSGDGVEILKNEPFEEKDRKGQYTHKIYHLASKLPSWMVSLLPKNALILEEEAWNAYPHCTTVLKCPFLGKFKLILETNHVADRGTAENALNMDPKTLKKRQVEFIDIAMDQVENYVAEEDPTLFKSQKTGRGPLKEGWVSRCDPVMCAYKCVTVDVPYWGFGSRIEKFIAKNAQRKILLEGHRKCFTWLDEWHGLTMNDVRRMEAETAESLRRSRAQALRKLSAEEVNGEASDVCEETAAADEEADSYAVSGPLEHDEIKSPKTGEANGVSSTTSSTRSRQSLRRRSFAKSSSNVGPSFSMGIATISATERESAAEFQPGRLSSSAPPRPVSSPNEWNSVPTQTAKTPTATTAHLSEKMAALARAGSCESFEVRSQLKNLSWELQQYSSTSMAADDMDNQATSSEVSKCVDVLDRAINWAKALRAKRDAMLVNGGKKSGAVTPIDDNSDNTSTTRDEAKPVGKEVDQYIDVLDSALFAVKMRPSR